MIKRIIKISLGVILIGVFVWTIYFLYTKSESKPIRYGTETASVQTIIKKTVATGSVIPRKEIEIKSQVSGIIDKIYVEAGDEIKAGDLISKIKIIPNMVSLNAAESRVKRAQLSLENASKDLDRNRKLFNEKVIPAADWEKIELAQATAIEELESAENNLQLIKEGVSKSSGKATNTFVRSTISGMVLDVPVKEGNSVIESNTFNDGTTIASVANMNDMIFEGNVDESEVGKITSGMKLILIIGAIEDATFDAILEYIAPKGVEEDGAIQFEIRANLELDENYFIRAGYSANADIVLDRRDSVMAINEALLQFDEEQAFVEIEVKEQEFERKDIEVGLSDGIQIEILSGITMKDKIKNLNVILEDEDEEEEPKRAGK